MCGLRVCFVWMNHSVYCDVKKDSKKTSRPIAFSNMLESVFVLSVRKQTFCKGFSLQTVKLYMGSELFEES